MKNNDIIIETVTIGAHTKMTAIDGSTGVEATIIIDPKMPRAYLEKLAIQKLNYILAKK